jgi:hypothetical protein
MYRYVWRHINLGPFSDLRQRLYCPSCRLLVSSEFLAYDTFNEKEDIFITLNYGQLHCNAFPYGVEIQGVHLDEEEDEFGADGRIVKSNEIDVRSPLL